MSCQADSKITWTPKFFTEEEAKSLTAALDVLIPATDTPGAIDAGVPEFIDLLAADLLEAEEKQQFKDGIAQMDADSQAKFGKLFVQASREQQTELLVGYDNATFGTDTSNKNEFFENLKNTAVWAFCTSEKGATQHLQYELNPGGYTNCVPIAEVGGKTWAI
ncbi:MAG: gluconate 2-dehydrogenase subunit 3 family protein [Saprospiraceae bacterium]|nr:gluconate 2-dehydrogenase subunit 3 family protein [Saprospiraceae bacterium]